MSALASVRYLIGLLLLVACFGAIEIAFVNKGFHNRSKHINEPESMEAIAGVYETLYPELAMGHYIRGAIAVKNRRRDGAMMSFRKAIEHHGTHENILYDYASNMVATRAPAEQIDEAVDQWRWHYPKSQRPDPREFAPPSLTGDSNYYLAAVGALRASEFQKARRLFEQDLSAGSRSEQLFYNYALTLVLSDADRKEIERAVENWKAAYPDSERTDPRVAVSNAQR